jgi:hypothetical protein
MRSEEEMKFNFRIQRSYFANRKRYDMMGEDWKNQRREEERWILRGEGEVGTPGCNPVMAIVPYSCPPEMLDEIVRRWNTYKEPKDEA